MHPAKLKPGDKVMVACIGAVTTRTAYFVRREPARGKGRPAKNWLRFPDFAGLDGPQDEGLCTMSDYELSRRGRLADQEVA